VLALFAACRAPEAPPAAPPAVEAAVEEMPAAESIARSSALRGRMIVLVSPAPYQDFSSTEGFMCDGRWFNMGGGHNATAGSYTLDGDRLCVRADSFAACRRVELRDEGRTVRLHSERVGSTPLDYRLDRNAEVCAEE
jgi:hypothetical protein